MTEAEIARIAAAVAAAVGSEGSSGPENMTLKAARALIAKVEQKAAEIGVKAVIAVADRGAHPVAVACMDGAYIASYDIAVNKAYTCAALQMPTTELKGLSQPGQPLYGIQFTNGGRIVIFGGGVPLKSGGQTIGALGVSGGTEEQDTYLAAYGEAAFAELLPSLA